MMRGISGSIRGLTGRAVRGALRIANYDLVPLTADKHPLARRAALLRRTGVTDVVDVGANSGQSGLFLREAGFRGPIVSLEPMSAARAKLETHARRDRRWSVLPYAAGDVDGTLKLNVAGGDGQASSLHPMLPLHAEAAPETRYVATESVSVRRLDSIQSELGFGASARVYLKIDAQGHTHAVLIGAERLLRDHVVLLQVEHDLAELYEGEVAWQETDRWIVSRGFMLADVTSAWSDPRTGQLLAMDATYVGSCASGITRSAGTS